MSCKRTHASMHLLLHITLVCTTWLVAGVKSIQIQATPPVGRDMLRQNKVAQMMKHAWNNHSESPPMNRNYFVSAVSTLYIMNLTNEYDEARRMVDTSINENTDFRNIGLSANWVSDSLGGILSAHALSGDSIFRQKIDFMINRSIPMLPDLRVPKAHFTRKTTYTLIGGYMLESNYLQRISTGWNQLADIAYGVRRFALLKPKTLMFTNDLWNTTLDTFSDSFSRGGPSSVPQYRIHEDLLRIYLATNRSDEVISELLDDYVSSALISVRQAIGGRYYVQSHDGRMQHSSCSLGSFLAILAKIKYANTSGEQTLMQMAEGITQTCRDASVLNDNVDPAVFTVDRKTGAIKIEDQGRYYLGYAAVQNYFVLWRLTHDEKYRQWGWDNVIGLETVARRPKGYSDSAGEELSWFPGATLKFLYLLFSADADISLDEWVFNRCGHPFPR